MEVATQNMSLPEPAELINLKTPELKKLFAESLEYTAKHLTYLGYIWAELESRGEDLSALRKGVAVYIPMIAYGKVDANLVMSYAGQKTLLNKLSQLPLHEQKKLATSGSVTYVHPDTKESMEIDLVDLDAKMIFQVFSETNIRTPEAQLKLINKAEYRPKAPARKPRLVSNPKVEDDHIIVSNKRIEIDKTLEVLSKHFKCDIQKLIDTHIAD